MVTANDCWCNVPVTNETSVTGKTPHPQWLDKHGVYRFLRGYYIAITVASKLFTQDMPWMPYVHL